MSGKTQQTGERKPVVAGFIDPDAPPTPYVLDLPREGRPPVIEWTEWKPVEHVTDEDVSYSISNAGNGNAFRSPTLTGMHPYHKTRTRWERKLLARWSDQDGQAMGMVVTTEDKWVNG